jgi:hypothetical protein
MRKPLARLMGSLIVMMIWCVNAAQGQGVPGDGGSTNPLARPTIPTSPVPETAPAPANMNTNVLPSGTALPEPIALDQIQAAPLNVPDVPVEPYLLTPQQGPFMVMARTFRGPEASKYALALCMELRNRFQLPAYIYYMKIRPGGSNIQNVMPTAAARDAGVKPGNEPAIEKYRTYDEAAVLVGNAKTIDDSEKILKRVKGLKPECLEQMPTIWGHRKGEGLKRAMLTTNPLIPAQYLYPGKERVPAGTVHGHAVAQNGLKPGSAFDPYVATASLNQRRPMDPLLKRMNSGGRNLTKCPAPYALQVAEFSGRQSLDVKDTRFLSDAGLKSSPLRTAHEDAERMADSLMKCKAAGGFQAYVYHDRSSSKVFIGGFTGPDDPNVKKVMDAIPAWSQEMLQRGFSQLPLAPATMLTPVPEG